MIIPVTLAPKDSNPKLPSGLVKISHDEIVLIELQGVLEVDSSNPTERNGRLVGKLMIDDATNKPSLLIGHHLLEGKIAALPKPYAILVRTGYKKDTLESDDADDHLKEEDNEREDEDEPEAMQVDGDGETQQESSPELLRSGSASSSGGGWTIAGLVKKKIIFSKRPMPVIGKKS